MKKYFFLVITFCSGNFAFSQPAVRNEPRHHNVFENDYVRVLDVYLAPHDTTQFHVHATPSVFITFTKTATASQLIGQQAVKSLSVAGGVWYDSLITPRIHRVWNEDTTWFHVMDVEITAAPPYKQEPGLQISALKLLFDEPQVRGYLAQLTAQENITIPASATGYLLISVGEAAVTLQQGSTIQHRLMKAGHYCWINEETIITGDAPSAFIVLQLK